MYREALDTARFLATEPTKAARVGQSPHRIVARDNKASLRYFAPATGPGVPRHPPLFVSMPLINTWTIFDLLPGRSVVEKLVADGVPVYILDWGRPGPEDRDTPLAVYVDRLLGRMIDRACRHAGVATIDALGYCVGGTFLAMHLARGEPKVRRVAFLCTPIDFHVSGRLATWARPENFPLDAIVDGFGNFPRELMRESFAWLRPAGMVSKWRALHDRIDDPDFRTLWAALEHWNADGVDFPGEAYRAYVRGCYFDNALVRGGWMLDGRPVDLSKATQPAFVLVAAEDHIVSPPAAFALADVWGAPVQTATLRGGHVAVCVTAALPQAILTWIREA
jgi:polyhydroxyalkanoate synthase